MVFNMILLPNQYTKISPSTWTLAQLWRQKVLDRWSKLLWAKDLIGSGQNDLHKSALTLSGEKSTTTTLYLCDYFCEAGYPHGWANWHGVDITFSIEEAASELKKDYTALSRCDPQHNNGRASDYTGFFYLEANLQCDNPTGIFSKMRNYWSTNDYVSGHFG